MNALQKSFRYFHPRHHLWFQATPIASSKITFGKNHNNNDATTTAAIKNKTLLSSKISSPMMLQIEIGFTERGMEDIGDVIVMQKAVNESTTATTTTQENLDQNVSRDTPLLTIEWEGHSITSADELYHTVWDNFSGTSRILTPFSGTVQEINDQPNPQLWFDEDTVLVKMTTTTEEWNKMIQTTSIQEKKTILVKEPEYIRTIQSQPRGRFAESTDNDDDDEKVAS